MISSLPIIFHLLAVMPQILLGAALSLSTHDFYTVYLVCGRTFNSISPIADQHLVGLIL